MLNIALFMYDSWSRKMDSRGSESQKTRSFWALLGRVGIFGGNSQKPITSESLSVSSKTTVRPSQEVLSFRKP